MILQRLELQTGLGDVILTQHSNIGHLEPTLLQGKVAAPAEALTKFRWLFETAPVHHLD